MNIQFKQRLVGAIVLISLAVIIVPLLLPGEGSLQKAPPGSRLPPAPEYRFAPLKSPPPAPMPIPAPRPLEAPPAEPSAGGETALPVPDLPVDTATPTEAEAEPPVPSRAAGQAQAKSKDKAKTDTATPAGWVVQVASFSRRDNALALRDRLRQHGHPCFVEAVKDAKGQTVYRVRVGPLLSRGEAETLQRRLVEEVDLKGLVLRYP